MGTEHEPTGHLHPWELHDGGLPLTPFPSVIPEGFVLNPEMLESRSRMDTPPPGGVHNHFVPPARRIVQNIIQPNPQSGNKQGKRQ